MKRLKHNFKKGMAFFLSLAMVAGLVSAMLGGANKVQAAAGSGTEPSVTAFATKDQLMGDTFKPDAYGNATTIGKLVFGKNSDGNPQEWYILGKDEGVSGDNTIIVAASPIARGQKFNSDIGNKNDENLWSDCVYSEATITEVYANHYGASELRDTLQGMATNTSYFTSAEQGLMNATTVTTKDTKNSSVTYTTTDKLYALQGDYDNDQYLWAGTDDSTVLAMSSYLRNGEWFWLRSPFGRSGDIALCADRGYYVILCRVDIDSGSHVQPASNLDLSSVLFASAATAASSGTEAGTIAEGTAMTLRLDGTDKNIGTVTYNTTAGNIKATKGSTTSNVALVVQGNDGTKDWYYSKQITWTPSDTTAGYNTRYTASITLTADTGYEFADNVTATVSGNTATSVTKNADGTLTVTKEFTTDKRKIESVAAPTVPANNTFTTYYGYDGYDETPISGTNTELGKTATVTFEGTTLPTTADMAVTWTIVSNGGVYDNTPGAENTFRWTIPASALTNYNAANCQGYDTSTGNITGTIKLKNKAATSYKIISGADSEWKQNTDGNITIRGNGEFSKFESVKVDGSIIDAKNYTAKEGSTIIILKADYLKTLSVGTHSFEIVWTDGSAVTNFKVSKNTDDSQQPTPPQTGDNSRPMLWVTLLAASLAGLLALLGVRRKKDDKYMQR